MALEKILVPLKHTDQRMHGYFVKSRRETDGSTPTVIWLNGAESLVEDVYWWCGAEGIDRGFNVFSVDAPGDTATRIHNPDMKVDRAGDRALHCQLDNFPLARQIVFDWFEGLLRRDRKNAATEATNYSIASFGE